MRSFLLGVIVLEALVLVAGIVVLFTGDDDAYRARRPLPPAFRPPLYDAVIGDRVRYQRRELNEDGTPGRVVGYLDYEVTWAEEVRGTTLGRTFLVKLTQKEEGKTPRHRVMRIRPRDPSHGFLPPRIDEDDRPTSVRPIIKTIRTAPVRVRKRDREGFLIEAVTPRNSLTEISERYWMAAEVPVFGVARWDRDGEALVLHSSHRGRPS